MGVRYHRGGRRFTQRPLLVDRSQEANRTADSSEIDDLFAPLLMSDVDDDRDPVDDATVDPAQAVPNETARRAFALARPPRCSLQPRPYQADAVTAWTSNGVRGVVVMPTGSGKTIVALLIAARVELRTLVVVPTIELLHQWRRELASHLGYPLDEIGIVSGGKRTVRDITVITYDFAAMPHRRLDDVGLLVVDEVHHLPARAYQAIAHKSDAPYLLGLSATPERSDHRHRELDRLIGPVVHRSSTAELARDEHIANFDEKRVFIDLSPNERLRYDQSMSEYKQYLASRRGSLGGGNGIFVEMIRRAGQDPGARAALRAHHRARMIALNAEAKIAAVSNLLIRHRHQQVIVFSEYNAMVDTLSECLFLPSITHRTPAPERREVLTRFRSGQYSQLVTGRVLNEGVDVPDASVAIVVSGSSANREYIQRLGRILRPKRQRAILYELISRDTTETRSARQRRPKNTNQPAGEGRPAAPARR